MIPFYPSQSSQWSQSSRLFQLSRLSRLLRLSQMSRLSQPSQLSQPSRLPRLPRLLSRPSSGVCQPRLAGVAFLASAPVHSPTASLARALRLALAGAAAATLLGACVQQAPLTEIPVAAKSPATPALRGTTWQLVPATGQTRDSAAGKSSGIPVGKPSGIPDSRSSDTSASQLSATSASQSSGTSADQSSGTSAGLPVAGQQARHRQVPTLTLAAQGDAASGFSGCNSYSARYTLDGERLRIGPPAITKRMCDGSAMHAERAFLGVLAAAASVHQQGEMLTLRAEDGTTLATFRAHPR